MKILQKLIRVLQVLEALIAFRQNVKNPNAESRVMRDIGDGEQKKTLHISLY